MTAHPLARGILAVVAGVLLGVLVIGLVEYLGHALFPPPADIDTNDPADLARLWEVIPIQSKLMVVAAWFLGSLAGACAAIAIARRLLPAWTVGLIIAAMGLWTSQMFPHPPWMVVAALVLPLVAVLVARRLMARRIAAQDLTER